MPVEARRFALFGHPVSHSLSPAIHAAAFAALGLPHTYEAIDLGSEAELLDAVQALRRGELAGANVTAPHKRRALELADAAAPSAEAVGAANVLRREPNPAAPPGPDAAPISAHNTDVDALVAELSEALPIPDNLRRSGTAVVLGAGGAALASIVALKRLGFPSIGVTTRSFSSPAALASPSALRLRELGAVPLPFPGAAPSGPSNAGAPPPAASEWTAWLLQADVLVQATSAGTRSSTDPTSGDALAALIPWDHLRPSALAFDLVYNPRVTPFLRRAEQRGLAARGGLGMLVRQAALSIELWTGLTPPLDLILAAAEQALA